MKKFISIFICVCLMMVVLAGCSSVSTVDAKENQQSRIAVVDIAEQTLDIYTYVIVDKETGVSYLWVDGYQNGGLTVMVDENGDPLIWEKEV